MTRGRIFPQGMLVLVSALAAGCAHSPDPVFYALSARSGAQHPTRPLVVELRRPSLPPYLDHQHIVRRTTAERLDLDGDLRWAAPLDELTTNTLAQDLAARLPSCFVFTEGHGIGARPDIRIEVEISRFELDERGQVDLDALLTLEANLPAAQPFFRHDRFATSPTTGDAAGMVGGMSVTLAELADAIASSVARLQASG